MKNTIVFALSSSVGLAEDICKERGCPAGYHCQHEQVQSGQGAECDSVYAGYHGYHGW